MKLLIGICCWLCCWAIQMAGAATIEIEPVRRLAVGDLTGDEIPDMAVATADGRIVIYVQDKSGNFKNTQTLQVPKVFDIALADVDEDRIDDILVVDQNHCMWIFFSREKFRKPLVKRSGNQISSTLQTGKLQSGSLVDTLTAAVIRRLMPDQTVYEAYLHQAKGQKTIIRSIFCDINGDGVSDILVANGDAFKIYYGPLEVGKNKTGAFGIRPEMLSEFLTLPLPKANEYHFLAVDLQQNGLQDIVFCPAGGGPIRSFEQDRFGGFGAKPEPKIIFPGWFGRIAVGDFVKRGHVQLAAVTGKEIFLYSLPDKKLIGRFPHGISGNICADAVRDIDGDGIPELILASARGIHIFNLYKEVHRE